MFALLLFLVVDGHGTASTRFNPLPTGFVAAESVARSGKRLVAEEGVLAFAPTRAGRVLFTAEGAFFPAVVPGAEADEGPAAKRPAHNSPDAPQALVVLGSGLAGMGKRAVEPHLERPLPGRLNFLIGPQEDWQVGLTSFAELVYPDVWSGVDLIFEARAGGLGYRLELAAGADAAAIQLSTGAERLLVLEDGSLRAERGGAWLHIGRPRAFQRIGDSQQEVEVAFAPGQNGQYGFSLGAYDPRLPLTIDPSLSWSTYLTGWYSDKGRAVAVDGDASAYVTGTTQSSDFPITLGVFDTSHNTYWDVFVSKISPDGGSLQFSTFLGGSSSDYGVGIAVDSVGSAYLTGYTDSTNFPTTVGALDASHNGSNDVFVSKLSDDGAFLLYSTYLGGSASDSGNGIALDSFGSAYVRGTTVSTNFPTTGGVHDSDFNGGANDAFVSKLSADGSSLAYSTYLGGSNDDNGQGIAVDSAGSAFLTGYTDSANFPTTPGTYAPSHKGGWDIFVSKLSVDGSFLVYSSFLGGTSNDYGQGIAVDSAGSAYLTGETNSADFPATAGTYDPSLNGGYDVFASKLSSDGSTLTFSGYLGGSGEDYAYAIALDDTGSACLTGHTQSSDFPITPGAHDQSYNGFWDVFLAKIGTDGSTLTFSSYLGGSYFDYAYGIAVDYAGSVYLTGHTQSPDFPTTAGVFDPSHLSGEEVFVSKLCPIAQPGSISGTSTVCIGASAVAYSISAVPGAVDYTWSVPPGSTIGSGQGTTSITVDFASISGDISVIANAPCPSDPQILAITLLEAATINGQPDSVSGCIGDAVTFSVSASGTAPLSYQWYHDSSPLSGQTTASLVLDPIAASDAGTYRCEVSNPCGSEMSNSALLTLGPLGITLNPRGAAQGIHHLVLEGGPFCGNPNYEVQWTNLTAGFVYGIDENPITVVPVLSETSMFEFRVTDGRSRATTTALVPVLVHHFTLLDWDDNGCSELADLWLAMQSWRSAYPGDPNDDGFMDIRDYLYINTDGCP